MQGLVYLLFYCQFLPRILVGNGRDPFMRLLCSQSFYYSLLVHQKVPISPLKSKPRALLFDSSMKTPYGVIASTTTLYLAVFSHLFCGYRNTICRFTR